jgi:copper chaperone CopZ
MKRINVMMVAVLLSAAAFSQVKAVRVETIKVPNAVCDLCKTRITDYLKRHDGVLEVTVYTRREEVKVKYVTDRINIEEIKTAISNLGYEAGDVPVNEDAYRRLPITCKKFSDGGGHPKPKVAPVVQ